MLASQLARALAALRSSSAVVAAAAGAPGRSRSRASGSAAGAVAAPRQRVNPASAGAALLGGPVDVEVRKDFVPPVEHEVGAVFSRKCLSDDWFLLGLDFTDVRHLLLCIDPYRISWSVITTV